MSVNYNAAGQYLQELYEQQETYRLSACITLLDCMGCTVTIVPCASTLIYVVEPKRKEKTNDNKGEHLLI